MSKIQNLLEFEKLLRQAIDEMAKIVKDNSGDSFLESINRQLDSVHSWTKDGKRPSDEQLEKLSFGTMASRSLDEIDPQLAQILYRLANYLDDWKRRP